MSSGLDLSTDFRRYLESGELLKDVKEVLDCWIVGEDKNKILTYLLLLQDQSIVIKGDTSTGKNTIADNVLRLFPEDEIVTVTSVTAKALRWLQRHEIGILYIKEVPHDVIDSTFSAFALDLKQVMSDKVLRPLATDTTGSTPRTLLRTIKIRSILQTTTEYELPEDIENRVWVLTSDASTAQTKNVCIYKARKREEGIDDFVDGDLLSRVRIATDFLFRNKWRVKIPKATKIAEKLAKICPIPRLRRDIDKIFDLIEGIARVHGRAVATAYDIKYAFELVSDIFNYMVKRIDPRLLEAYKVFREIEEREAFVTASDLAKELNISQTDARRKLRALINAGLVEEAGRGERGVRLYKSLLDVKDLLNLDFIDDILKD